MLEGDGGPFFPEWEFELLFGLTREEVRTVLSKWPANMASKDATTAVNNTGYSDKLDACARFIKNELEELAGPHDPEAGPAALKKWLR